MDSKWIEQMHKNRKALKKNTRFLTEYIQRNNPVSKQRYIRLNFGADNFTIKDVQLIKRNCRNS